MSRQVYRVPLDFKHPMNKVWDGFVNPVSRQTCPSSLCRNGQTPARARLEDIIRLIDLAAGDANRGKCHPYFFEGFFYNSRGDTPGADFLELAEGIKKAGAKIGAHTVEWTIERTLITMAGLNYETWGICPVCKGTNIDPAFQERYDNWEREKPPTGDGWQMWETVSEGSPISPVFATPEKLAEWLSGNEASACGSMTASYASWLKMIMGSGWAPSCVVDGGELLPGVEWLAKADSDEPATAP